MSNDRREIKFALIDGPFFIKIFFTQFSYLPQPRIHIETWINSNGIYRSPIDYIICNTSHSSNILDVGSLRGDTIDRSQFCESPNTL